jgi:hypothetical protein
MGNDPWIDIRTLQHYQAQIVYCLTLRIVVNTNARMSHKFFRILHKAVHLRRQQVLTETASVSVTVGVYTLAQGLRLNPRTGQCISDAGKSGHALELRETLSS